MTLRDVAATLRSHSVRIDYAGIKDPDTRKALEEVERLFRRMINDIARNVEVGSSATFTRTATVVESHTLAASASASATNNNNVLAALLADLAALGLISVA